MRLYKAVILVNLAFGLGLLAGYLWWERDVSRLQRNIEEIRRNNPPASGQSWTVNGIVRAALPNERLLVITHDRLPGLMGSMTMAFRVADPRLTEGVTPGDRVEFTVVKAGGDLILVALRKQGSYQ